MNLEPKNKNEITDENYYSQEIGKKYLSVHALMTFMKDPALFYLKGNGYLKNTSSPSANAGKLFHAFVNDAKDFEKEVRNLGKEPFLLGRKKISEDEVVDMVFNEPELLKPKSDYDSVWSFILKEWDNRHDWWEEKPWFKELILTGTIGDAPFKGRLDVLKIDGDKAYIYDYKTIGLKERYGFWYEDDERFEKTFIHEYNYDLQMTAYAELVKQNFPQVKHVYVTFGCLIKKGKHEFSEYPSSFIETETVNVMDLHTQRFNGDSPLMVLMKYSLPAYQTLQMSADAFIEKYGDDSLFSEMIFNKHQQLPFESFKLK